MNKNLFTIDESEKRRILEMHQGATKNQYVFEQTQSVEIGDELQIPGLGSFKQSPFGRKSSEPGMSLHQNPNGIIHAKYNCSTGESTLNMTTATTGYKDGPYKSKDAVRGFIDKFNASSSTTVNAIKEHIKNKLSDWCQTT